jgi:transcriptional regulator with XRE-family HTH domain
MATVQRWSGQETRLLRHAMRLTVRAFAEDLGVCVRTVSKWEATGPALTPRPELQAALDTMLRRAGDEERERFHATAGTASETLSTSPLETQHVVAAVADARRYLDSAAVDYFRRQLALLMADDGRRGADVVLPLLLGMLGAIQGQANELRPEVRRDLLAVAADTAEFAGRLYREAHDATRARYWHERATEWA